MFDFTTLRYVHPLQALILDYSSAPNTVLYRNTNTLKFFLLFFNLLIILYTYFIFTYYMSKTPEHIKTTANGFIFKVIFYLN